MKTVAGFPLGEKPGGQIAPAITTGHIAATLISLLEFLRQQPPAKLREGSVEEVLDGRSGTGSRNG